MASNWKELNLLLDLNYPWSCLSALGEKQVNKLHVGLGNENAPEL